MELAVATAVSSNWAESLLELELSVSASGKKKKRASQDTETLLLLAQLTGKNKSNNSLSGQSTFREGLALGRGRGLQAVVCRHTLAGGGGRVG